GAPKANKDATINAPVNLQALLLEGTYTGKVTALAPFSAPTTVTAGTLVVDGPNGFTGAATVGGAGTLGGTGAINTITANAGTVNPGDGGPGTLRSTSVDFSAAATFFVDLTHVSSGAPVPGVDNDLLQ